MACATDDKVNWGGINYGSQISENFGTVINHFGAPANRAEGPPVPSCNIPYRRDVEFVARDCLLNDLAERCAQPAARVALVGIGGVGKSQLAIEFCHRLHEHSPDTWIFWVHASNISRIQQGFREIAEIAKIIGREDPNNNIFELVSRWLRNKKHGKWLMVLDSLDEHSSLSLEEATSAGANEAQMGAGQRVHRRLTSVLPQTDQGTIIITSRRRDVAERLVNYREIIAVETMNDDEARLLLVKKLQITEDVDHPDVTDLVTVLEHMPMAIAQAAAYIYQRKPRYSVRQYVNEFQRDEQQSSKLLTHEADSLRRDEDARNSILTTWQISFDYICQQYQSAADLLSLMSFFDGKAIPEYLLRIKEQVSLANSPLIIGNILLEEFHGHPCGCIMKKFFEHTVVRLYEDSDTFEEDLIVLRNFSMITVAADNISFVMHRLVQLGVRQWLDQHDRGDRYWSRFLKKLRTAFAYMDLIARPESMEGGELLPHAKVAENSVYQQRYDNADLIVCGEILGFAGLFAGYLGNTQEANSPSSKSIIILQKSLGPGDVAEVGHILILARLYMLHYCTDKAEKLLLRTKHILVEKFGEVHLSVLRTIEQLAHIYRLLRRYDEELEMLRQGQILREKLLLSNLLRKLTNQYLIFNAYYQSGRMVEAKRLGLDTLSLSERTLGHTHYLTFILRTNLARLYLTQGRPEAEKICLQLIDVGEILFVDHVDVRIYFMIQLITCYEIMNRSSDAATLVAKVFDIMSNEKGEKAFLARGHIGALMSILERQGRLIQAEELGTRCLTTHERVYGKENLHTVHAVRDLAAFHIRRQHFQKAEELHLRSLSTLKEICGDINIVVLESMDNLISAYIIQKNYMKATDLQYQLVRGLQEFYGNKSEKIFVAMAQLITSLAKQDRHNELIDTHTECVSILEAYYGENNEKTLECKANLAKYYAKGQHLAKAIEIMTSAVDGMKKELGKEHKLTLESMSCIVDWLLYYDMRMETLSDIFVNRENLAKARQIQSDILSIRQMTLGKQHKKTLRAMLKMAVILFLEDSIEQAVRLLNECRELSIKYLGADHSLSQDCLDQLESWQILQGRKCTIVA